MGHFAGRAAAWLGVGWDHIFEHATVDAARVVLAVTKRPESSICSGLDT
jgi:hypothetical protein